MLGPTEIKHRFGFHKATTEITAIDGIGLSPTEPKHRATRLAFIEFADFLDGLIYDGRAKAVMMTELETASMWAHKAIAEKAPVVDEPVKLVIGETNNG